MKLRRLHLAILMLTQLPRPLLSADVYFSPGRDCESQIVRAITNSSTEIVAAVYSINNDRIVDALRSAKTRGVKIRILTDRTQAAGPSSKIPALSGFGLNVRVHSKNKIEHNKFGVFDGTTAINGSYNWTNPASDSNSENCVVFNEKNVIKSYQGRFEELWKMNTEEKSKTYLTKIIQKHQRRTASEK